VRDSTRHRRFGARPHARASLAPTPNLKPQRDRYGPAASILPSVSPPEAAPPDVQELVLAFENLMALVDLYESLMNESDIDYDSRCLVEEAREVAEVEMLREFIPSRLRDLERATQSPTHLVVEGPIKG